MPLSKQKIEEYAKGLVELANSEKEIVVSKILEIIEPHLRNSGYVDESNYVNGFLPKGEEKQYYKIAELPTEIYIPECFVSVDKTLNHFANEEYTVSTGFISNDGLYLDFGSFSNFYEHSLEVLKLVLAQLQNMNFSETKTA